MCTMICTMPGARFGTIIFTVVRTMFSTRVENMLSSQPASQGSLPARQNQLLGLVFVSGLVYGPTFVRSYGQIGPISGKKKKSVN